MNKKKQFNFYPFYDTNGMNEHLSDMSRKGWHVCRTGLFLWEYEKGEPRELQYSVSYSPDGDPVQPENDSWYCAAQSSRLQVFASEEEHPEPVISDPYDVIEGIHQAGRPAVVLYITMLVLTVLDWIMMGFRLTMQPVDVMADIFGLTVALALTLSSICFLFDLIHYFRWKNKADVGATKNEFVSASSRAGRALHGSLWAAILVLAIVTLTSGSSLLIRTFAVYLAGVLVLYFGLKGIRRMMAAKEKTPARALQRTVDLILCGIVLLSVFAATDGMKKADQGADKQLPVTVQDIYEVSEDRAFAQYFREKGSFLIEFLEASQAEQKEEELEPVFSYEMVKQRLVPVDGFVLQYYLNRNRGVGERQADGTFVPAFQYEEIDAAPWGAVKAWQMHQQGEPVPIYLVLFEDRLAEVGSTWDLDDQQKALAGEKFLES